MMQPISLHKLLTSSLPVYLAASIRKKDAELTKGDFVRQKTSEGLLIACWHTRTQAENLVNKMPSANKDYRVVEADAQMLQAIVANIGESADSFVFVLQN